jgi:hypothetical protein
MKDFVSFFIVYATMAVSTASAQTAVLPVDGTIQTPPIRPRSPGGILGDSLGWYVTIEGILYDGIGKVESNTLVVDTIDGKKLQKPVFVLVRNVSLPAKERCILKGYELGEMIGRPPAEYAAAREQGKDAEELARRDQTIWRWRPYFVVLIAAKPAGLEIRNP